MKSYHHHVNHEHNGSNGGLETHFAAEEKRKGKVEVFVSRFLSKLEELHLNLLANISVVPRSHQSTSIDASEV
jgi:hypothetical protein